MPLQDYPSWELQPRKLTSYEREDPISVIHDFFAYAHLPEARELLWELLKTTVTGSYCKQLSQRERANMLYFYEWLEKLLEAVHVIHRQQQKEDAEEEEEEPVEE